MRPTSAPFMNGHGNVPMTSLGSDIRRAVALTSNNGNGVAEGVQLSDGVGLTEPQVAELSDRLGVPVHGSTGSAIDMCLRGRWCCSLASRHLVPFDFTRSRLTPRPVRRFGRGTVWAAVIAGAGAGHRMALLLVLTRETEQTTLTEQLRGMDKQIKDSQSSVDRVNLGRSFFETRAPSLMPPRDHARVQGRDLKPAR